MILSFLIYLGGLSYGLASSDFPHIIHYYYIKEIIEPNFIALLNNNTNLILILVLGGLIFGVSTLINLFLNGYILGNALFYLLSVESNLIFTLILPHGIFEIPAIIIAGAAGFKIPYEIVRYLAGRKEQILTKDDIKEYLTLALISIILITVAAWIEANITLKIARFMLERGGV